MGIPVPSAGPLCYITSGPTVVSTFISASFNIDVYTWICSFISYNLVFTFLKLVYNYNNFLELSWRLNKIIYLTLFFIVLDCNKHTISVTAVTITATILWLTSQIATAERSIFLETSTPARPEVKFQKANKLYYWQRIGQMEGKIWSLLLIQLLENKHSNMALHSWTDLFIYLVLNKLHIFPHVTHSLYCMTKKEQNGIQTLCR